MKAPVFLLRLLLISIGIAACDTANEQPPAEDVVEEDLNLPEDILERVDDVISLTPGSFWVYEKVKKRATIYRDDSLTVTVSQERETYREREFQVLHFDFSEESQDYRVFARITETGLHLVSEIPNKVTAEIRYTEWLYLQPLQQDTTYFFDFVRDQDTLTWGVNAYEDVVHEHEDLLPCWRYEHFEPNEFAPIWQDCLDPGLGFVFLAGLIPLNDAPYILNRYLLVPGS